MAQEDGKLNASAFKKVLEKIDVDVLKEELFLDVKDGEIHINTWSPSQILAIQASFDCNLPDMQIPVSHLDKLSAAVGTFKKDITVSLEDRLILKGKNTKKVPLTKWSDEDINKIKNVFNTHTKDAAPVTIQKPEIDIITQDVTLFNKISEVIFKVENKTLTITMKDEIGFESETTIDDVNLPEGTYIIPTVIINILKKIDNIELYMKDIIAYVRDKGDNYEIKYIVALKK